MKQILAYIVTLIVIIVAIFSLTSKDSNPEIVQTPETKEAIGMCYFYSADTPSGFADRAWLKMSIVGDKVTGEYQNLPAEKDTKMGKFSGTVGKMDPRISGRIADVWWDSTSEGVDAKEQLRIEFGEGSAVALFGEMIKNSDGTYSYKDTTKLTPGFQMSQTDCEALDDRVIVENYIRENIKSIAPDDTVLGGTWYVVLVNINPTMKNGTMTYEDGHIQGKASFNYVRDGDEVSVSLIKLID